RGRPEPGERRAVHHERARADALDRAGSLLAFHHRMGGLDRPHRHADLPARIRLPASPDPPEAGCRRGALRVARTGWLETHPYLEPLARFHGQVKSAMASIGVVEAPVPNWDDYLADFH